METKKCKVCGRDLPLENFRPNKMTEDGRVSACRECITAKRMATRNSHLLVPEQCEKQYHDPRFSQFESRELIAELRHRGYKGELRILKTINV